MTGLPESGCTSDRGFDNRFAVVPERLLQRGLQSGPVPVADMDNRAIGVFDSGLGGLTTVKELRRLLPQENLIYFGDTGRVPESPVQPIAANASQAVCRMTLLTGSGIRAGI